MTHTEHEPLLRGARVEPPPGSERTYPFNIPAVRDLDRVRFHPRVTMLIGENGSGKSTILEALAAALGINPDGGDRNIRFQSRSSHSDLWKHLTLVKSYRGSADGFFLRAESMYNVATGLDQVARVRENYGVESLHACSHGESFLAVMQNRFGSRGIYLLDEPESALSPARQLAALRIIHQLSAAGTQFIIASHSPIIMGYPHARLYELGEHGIGETDFERTDHYAITLRFLRDRAGILETLLADDEPESPPE